MKFYKVMDNSGWQKNKGFDSKLTHLYAFDIDDDRGEVGVIGADGFVFESIFPSIRGDGTYLINARRVPATTRTSYEAVQ